MESLTMHDLTAAYALDALDPTEARQYEDAPRDVRRRAGQTRAARRRGERARVRGRLACSAGELCARGSSRTARAERPNVVPLRSRRTAAIAALAAVAAVAAIGLRDLGRLACRTRSTSERSARQKVERLARRSDEHESGCQRHEHRNALRRPRRQGGARRLGARQGAQRADVRGLGDQGQQAGARRNVRGRPQTTVIPLEHEVPSGPIVAVTLEREPGADAPHGKILLPTRRARSRTTISAPCCSGNAQNGRAGFASCVFSRSYWSSSCSPERRSRSG